ncbi:MAG: ATP-binding protein [Cyanobacteria bacterium P01_F01_bin.53]
MQPEIGLTPQLFSEAFPFHFALGADCYVIQAGKVLQRLIPNMIGCHLDDVFQIQRPQIDSDFDAICYQSRHLFILQSRHNDMALKGQMMRLDKQDVLLFLGAPIVTDISHLKKIGIKLKDFATYDPAADYLFLLQTKSNLMEELTAQQTKLKETLQEKEKMANLAEARAVDIEKALENLKDIQTQLVQTEKMSALGNLVAGVAHEINNPVGCILGNVGATRTYISELLGLLDFYAKELPNPSVQLEEELEAVDLDYIRQDLPKLINAMKESGDRIKSISKSLRTFSRADTETQQPFDLKEGIESTILILRHRLKANEQRPAIEVTTDYGDIPAVNCFPGQLNQVFMNILANAIDALDESSQQHSFAKLKEYPNRITIRTTLENQRVKIAISDNGPGISETVKAKIFDHLFTTKTVGKGTGLGLAIAQQIVVEKHGGSLTVRSELGQGTEFCIQLPL